MYVRACKAGAPQSCWPAESRRRAIMEPILGLCTTAFELFCRFRRLNMHTSCCFKFAPAPPLQLFARKRTHGLFTQSSVTERLLSISFEIKFTVTRVIKFKFACRSAGANFHKSLLCRVIFHQQLLTSGREGAILGRGE